MIDARTWTRPEPDEVRWMIDETGLSQQEIGRRLGVAGRRVRHWLADQVESDNRRISFCEWVALTALIEERRKERAAWPATTT